MMSFTISWSNSYVYDVSLYTTLLFTTMLFTLSLVAPRPPCSLSDVCS